MKNKYPSRRYLYTLIKDIFYIYPVPNTTGGDLTKVSTETDL